jgi:hypothetical protein
MASTWSNGFDRFIVEHRHGGVTFADLAPDDLIIDDDGVPWVWVSGVCDACGATRRERVDYGAMQANLGGLLREAGVDPADLLAALDAGDDATLQAMSERLRHSPGMLREALRGIRTATARDDQN